MFAYFLVFSAVVVGVFCVVQLIQTLGLEKTELAKKSVENRIYANPMNRYISDQTLLQLRLTCAMFSAAIFACIFIFVELPVYLLTVSLVIGWIGYMIPFWYYSLKLRKRKQIFEARILDLTLGLANGLRSGQALSGSLEAVTRSLDGPMHEELMVVIHEYRLGIELSEALERLCLRMPCEDLRLLVSSVKLTTQSGGSLADVLAKMTEMIRNRTEFQDKLQTMTAQGRFEAIAIAAAPLITFFILYFVDSELMAPMLHTTVGWCAIGIVLVLETIGFWVINKIVTIEV